MMLGGASLLAARPEAFLAFLVPTGVMPALRLAPGETKFTSRWDSWQRYSLSPLIITTWRFFRSIESSLNLQFQNQDLVKDLQIANSWAEALNQQLELRVRGAYDRIAAVQRAPAG